MLCLQVSLCTPSYVVFLEILFLFLFIISLFIFIRWFCYASQCNFCCTQVPLIFKKVQNSGDKTATKLLWNHRWFTTNIAPSCATKNRSLYFLIKFFQPYKILKNTSGIKYLDKKSELFQQGVHKLKKKREFQISRFGGPSQSWTPRDKQ